MLWIIQKLPWESDTLPCPSVLVTNSWISRLNHTLHLVIANKCLAPAMRNEHFYDIDKVCNCTFIEQDHECSYLSRSFWARAKSQCISLPLFQFKIFPSNSQNCSWILLPVISPKLQMIFYHDSANENIRPIRPYNYFENTVDFLILWKLSITLNFNEYTWAFLYSLYFISLHKTFE